MGVVLLSMLKYIVHLVRLDQIVTRLTDQITESHSYPHIKPEFRTPEVLYMQLCAFMARETLKHDRRIEQCTVGNRSNVLL